MNRPDTAIRHVGIFGRRLSGKSTLARELVLDQFRSRGWLSIVLAPMSKPGDWPRPPCHWWKDRDAWLRSVWKSWACNVVCDDASMTIKRDRELEELFTCVGHRSHRLWVLGHSGANLLPAMREQLTEIFLFRQSKSEAELWAELFADDRILEARTLEYDRREFLHARLGGDVRRCVLSLPKTTVRDGPPPKPSADDEGRHLPR